jgi:polyhydroxybutyrate depolymerase
VTVPPPGRFRLRERRAWRSPDAPLPSGTTRVARPDGREYLLTVPTGAAPPAGRPLVLNLHGFTSNLVQQAAYSRVPQLGADRGYVVVTPQGTGLVPRWSFPRLPGPDDAGFLRSVVDEIAATRSIDPRRIYATGISNGAAMTMALADLWPGYFAAVAPVAGVNAIPARPVAGLPVCAFHGRDDRIVPYRGSTLFAGFRPGGDALRRRPGPRFALPAVEDVLATYARANGVDAAPVVTQVGPDVRHLLYATAPRIELFSVEGGGHTWPGSVDAVRLLGATSRTIDATAVMLDRFDADADADAAPAPG